MSRYLSFEEVVEINANVVKKFGGVHALRDAGALHAAVARPQSGYYADVVEEAAALFESLLQNHLFLDGNKRVGFTATAVFLRLNGFECFLTITRRINGSLDSWKQVSSTKSLSSHGFVSTFNGPEKCLCQKSQTFFWPLCGPIGLGQLRQHRRTAKPDALRIHR